MHFLYFYSVCVGCPKGWECCRWVWGKCVCQQPKWNSCCKQIPDPACVSANTACAAFIDYIGQGVKKIVDKGRDILNRAKEALSKAQGAVDSAKRAFNNAVKALDVVRTTYRVGVSALKAITKFIMTKNLIIKIKEMYFKVQLSAANGGKFQCRVKGVLVGRNIDLNLRFDTRNILSIAKSLGEKAVPGISKFFVSSYKSCRSGMAHNY